MTPLYKDEKQGGLASDTTLKAQSNQVVTLNEPLRYLSLFSGVGGFELGIHNAYRSAFGGEQTDTQGDEGQGLLTETRENTSATTRRPGKRPTDQSDERPLCIGYSEIDKYAIATYEHNFKGHTNYGDATKIDERQLPDFGLLVGGFPCQAFSIAGKRHGFNETRGTLFFDIARILAHKRPRHLVLENVKGLLSHDGGKTFSTIIGVLTDLGYSVEWQVLNAKDFGVPQNRERVFIIGHLGSECGRKVLPIKQDGKAANELPRHISNTLTARYEGAQATGTYIANTVSTGSTHTVATYVGEGKLDAQEDSSDRQIGGQDKTESNPDQFSRGPEAATHIRRLTPTECERLMSWPDGWTIGSDTQRYKQCGNGVVSNVVTAVITALCDEGCLQTGGIS